jgi:hypothetical protein
VSEKNTVRVQGPTNIRRSYSGGQCEQGACEQGVANKVLRTRCCEQGVSHISTTGIKNMPIINAANNIEAAGHAVLACGANCVSGPKQEPLAA